SVAGFIKAATEFRQINAGKGEDKLARPLGIRGRLEGGINIASVFNEGGVLALAASQTLITQSGLAMVSGIALADKPQALLDEFAELNTKLNSIQGNPALIIANTQEVLREFVTSRFGSVEERANVNFQSLNIEIAKVGGFNLIKSDGASDLDAASQLNLNLSATWNGVGQDLRLSIPVYSTRNGTTLHITPERIAEISKLLSTSNSRAAAIEGIDGYLSDVSKTVDGVRAGVRAADKSWIALDEDQSISLSQKANGSAVAITMIFDQKIISSTEEVDVKRKVMVPDGFEIHNGDAVPKYKAGEVDDIEIHKTVQHIGFMRQAIGMLDINGKPVRIILSNLKETNGAYDIQGDSMATFVAGLDQKLGAVENIADLFNAYDGLKNQSIMIQYNGISIRKDGGSARATLNARATNGDQSSLSWNISSSKDTQPLNMSVDEMAAFEASIVESKAFALLAKSTGDLRGMLWRDLSGDSPTTGLDASKIGSKISLRYQEKGGYAIDTIENSAIHKQTVRDDDGKIIFTHRYGVKDESGKLIMLDPKTAAATLKDGKHTFRGLVLKGLEALPSVSEKIGANGDQVREHKGLKLIFDSKKAIQFTFHIGADDQLDTKGLVLKTTMDGQLALFADMTGTNANRQSTSLLADSIIDFDSPEAFTIVDGVIDFQRGDQVKATLDKEAQSLQGPQSGQNTNATSNKKESSKIHVKRDASGTYLHTGSHKIENNKLVAGEGQRYILDKDADGALAVLLIGETELKPDSFNEFSNEWKLSSSFSEDGQLEIMPMGDFIIRTFEMNQKAKYGGNEELIKLSSERKQIILAELRAIASERVNASEFWMGKGHRYSGKALNDVLNEIASEGKEVTYEDIKVKIEAAMLDYGKTDKSMDDSYGFYYSTIIIKRVFNQFQEELKAKGGTYENEATSQILSEFHSELQNKEYDKALESLDEYDQQFFANVLWANKDNQIATDVTAIYEHILDDFKNPGLLKLDERAFKKAVKKLYSNEGGDALLNKTQVAFGRLGRQQNRRSQNIADAEEAAGAFMFNFAQAMSSDDILSVGSRENDFSDGFWLGANVTGTVVATWLTLGYALPALLSGTALTGISGFAINTAALATTGMGITAGATLGGRVWEGGFNVLDDGALWGTVLGTTINSSAQNWAFGAVFAGLGSVMRASQAISALEKGSSGWRYGATALRGTTIAQRLKNGVL
ncbi:MAG: hypothetical protein ACI9CF_002028, partial [Candidatus Omnitrophota bacterium]